MMQFKAGDRVQDKAKPSFKWVIQAVGLDGKTIVVAAEKHLLVRAWLPSSWFEKEKDMEQCTAMAMKPRYSKKGAVAMFLGYERGQCSRKAKVGSLCTQHTRMKARWAARK